MKRVLGLHFLSHDSGAALIADKRIVAISEERLSGRKYEHAFPERAIRYVLDAAGLPDATALDLIVFSHIESSEETRPEAIADRLGYSGPIVRLPHHDAHAASAFYASPFEDAAVMVVDGAGSWIDMALGDDDPHYLHALQPRLRELQSFYRGTGNDLTLIHRTYSTPQYPLGIGMLYAIGCVVAGFTHLDAGKLMGLAAYGGQNPLLAQACYERFGLDIVARGCGTQDTLHEDQVAYYANEVFNLPIRRSFEPLGDDYAELAHALQAQTVAAMLELSERLQLITRSDNLCMAGGVALNCPANTSISRQGAFKRIFVQPAASDTGIPLGCALYGYHIIEGQPRDLDFHSVFFGRHYGEAEILAALDGAVELRYERPDDLEGRCAERLADGQVVGWFQGGSELGPRALGNRSILAAPSERRMRDFLNEQVKGREAFRPYAPAVLEERASDYFEMEGPSPHMLYTYDIHAERRTEISAVVHEDGTARVQTVSASDNPRFRRLLESYAALTGLPVLLNTSLNLAGQPIVETPEDAISVLRATPMDALALGDFLVSKKN